ncbi:hypothetical protein MAR_004249, partial [Mya arenaria]
MDVRTVIGARSAVLNAVPTVKVTSKETGVIHPPENLSKSNVNRSSPQQKAAWVDAHQKTVLSDVVKGVARKKVSRHVTDKVANVCMAVIFITTVTFATALVNTAREIPPMLHAILTVYVSMDVRTVIGAISAFLNAVPTVKVAHMETGVIHPPGNVLTAVSLGGVVGYAGTVTPDTDNLKTALILAFFSVVSIVVGIICYLKTRKRFNRQQNERIEPCRVFSVGVQPGQQLSESLRRQNLDLYADINEETMEQNQNFGEQNSPNDYDEINIRIYDCDIGNVPSNEFTDDSNSLRSISKSEDKTGVDSTDETRSRRSVTHYYSDLDHA